jgi:chromosome partitioning protein
VSRVIAIFNQSGGVGKSTLAFNIGYHLTRFHQRVMLIDLDPQASLTLFCGLEPDELTQTIYEVIMDGNLPLPLHSIHDMSLVPANINLSGAEIELVTDGMRDLRLKEAIAPCGDDFDFILIDCPPSLGILSTIALVAANSVLVPIQTEYKSLMGTSLLLRTIARLKKRSNRELNIVGFVPNLYASGTTQHERGLTGIKEQLGAVARVFSPIPRRIDFANSVEEHEPLALFNPKHPALEVLDEIANHLIGGMVSAIA